MSNFHTPVLLKTAVDYLNIIPGNWYIDCNLGGGGHTAEILKRKGRVIGIDLDKDAITEAHKSLKAFQNDIIFFQDNFSNIDDIVSQVKTKIPDLEISGVLFDLGVSSHQLKTADRGFSFSRDAALDMRMNPDFGASAKDLVNGLYEKELAEIFTKYGEEPKAREIAKRIIAYRLNSPIESTNQLAKIVESVKRRRPQDKIHPATQIFQALRIAVNDELGSLEMALPKAFKTLKKDGRIVVISFHSLEDKIVKNFFQKMSQENQAQVLSRDPIMPSLDEIYDNPRARSAKMRVIEKSI